MKLAVVNRLERNGSPKRYLFLVHLIDGADVRTEVHRGGNGSTYWHHPTIPEGYERVHGATVAITPTEWKAMIARVTA